MGRRLVLILSAVATVLVAQAFVGIPSARALDRTPDNTYMTNGNVYATVLSEDGSTLYVGGKFTQVRENPPGAGGKVHDVNNVAAIHATGAKAGKPVLSWNAPEVTGDDATVHSLAVENGRLFIGGNFAAVEGQRRRNLAAVNERSGAVLDFNPEVGSATSIVEALLANGPRLYVGGEFTQVDEEDAAPPVTRKRLAAFDFDFATGDGTLDPAWDPETNNKVVRDLEFSVDKTSIFVAGSFNTVTGSDGTEEDRHSVARLFTNTGNLHPWNPSALIEHEQTVWDITVTDTRLYGAFGREQNYVAAFRLGSNSRVWKFTTFGNAHSVALSANGERLFIGGHFGIGRREQPLNRCSGKFLRGLGLLSAKTGIINCDWLPSVNGPRPNFVGIRDMAKTSSHLWVGGGFTGISGVGQRNLARFTL